MSEQSNRWPPRTIFGLSANTELAWRRLKDPAGQGCRGDHQFLHSTDPTMQSKIVYRHRRLNVKEVSWHVKKHAGSLACRGDATDCVLPPKRAKYPTPGRGAGCGESAGGVYDNLVKTVNESAIAAPLRGAEKRSCSNWIIFISTSLYCEPGGHSGTVPLKKPGNWCWPV